MACILLNHGDAEEWWKLAESNQKIIWPDVCDICANCMQLCIGILTATYSDRWSKTYGIYGEQRSRRNRVGIT